MRKNSIVTGLALALTLAAGGLASAQAAPRADRSHRSEQDSTARRGPRDRRGPGVLLRGITLTSAQRSQLETLRDAQRKQFDAARVKDDRPARERGDTTGLGARRAKMEQERGTHIAAIRGILDAPQRTQFDRNVAEMKARFSERGRNGRPDGVTPIPHG